jgi:hypothetical protein
VRTGRGSSPRMIDTYVKLNANSGGYYFIARDGEWLRRGDTFVAAEDLQGKFVDAMAKAGEPPLTPRR